MGAVVVDGLGNVDKWASTSRLPVGNVYSVSTLCKTEFFINKCLHLCWKYDILHKKSGQIDQIDQFSHRLAHDLVILRNEKCESL